MKNLRLKTLLDNYMANTLTQEEEKEFFDLLASDSFDREIKQYFLREYYRRDKNRTLGDEQSERILGQIIASNKEVSLSSKAYFNLSRISWAAAVIIITSGIILFYTLSNSRNNHNVVAKVQSHKYKNDVLPGSNGALLKLADGSLVVLDSTGSKTPIRQGNTEVFQNKGGLNYVNKGKKEEQNVVYNTVATPRGRQFQLQLEDGTQVWLNAASSINFPVVFSGNERDVSITGEVYFEVAKNKHKPFRVSVNGTTVEVLGTHFNINSYGDDGIIKTTLLEGSVKISKSNDEKILKPGEQAQVSEQGTLTTTKDVNLNEIVAWKNNLFSFNNIDIKQLMKQLSRWYDVDVAYAGNINNSVTFNGDISRMVNLSTVLKMLESTGEVSFTVENKKIMVIMQNN